MSEITPKTEKYVRHIKLSGKKYNLYSPRDMWQAVQHLHKLRDYVFDVRVLARRDQHLDYVQDLTEAHFHLGRAEAYLRLMCKSLFGKTPEELEGYK